MKIFNKLMGVVFVVSLVLPLWSHAFTFYNNTQREAVVYEDSGVWHAAVRFLAHLSVGGSQACNPSSWGCYSDEANHNDCENTLIGDCDLVFKAKVNPGNGFDATSHCEIKTFVTKGEGGIYFTVEDDPVNGCKIVRYHD